MSATEPEFVTIPEWQDRSGMGRSSTYEAIGRGEIIARKIGGSTLIDWQHGKNWLHSRPLAPINAKRKG
jgi:hypothetical protein